MCLGIVIFFTLSRPPSVACSLTISYVMTVVSEGILKMMEDMTHDDDEDDDSGNAIMMILDFLSK